MTDPKTIARGLSEPQRRAVLWCPADGSARAHVKGSPSEVSFFALTEKIVGDPRKKPAVIFKLIERANGYQPINRQWPVAEYRLTPLGLDVRKLLQETPQ